MNTIIFLMAISDDQVPDEWTNDPADLEEHFHPDGALREMIRNHGLTEAELILFNTPSSGEMCYLLESGKNYYWGDYMCDDIFLITKPKTLRGVLDTIATEGDQDLRMRKVKKVELAEEETKKGEEQKE